MSNSKMTPAINFITFHKQKMQQTAADLHVEFADFKTAHKNTNY